MKYNFIFTGSFQFPCGFAGTKRINNLINELDIIGCSSTVLLISNKLNKRTGYNCKTFYYSVIGNNKEKIYYLFSIFYYLKILYFLIIKKNKNVTNVFYVYSGINIENIIIVLFAKVLKYRIVVDVVEDFSLSKEKTTLWRGFKNSTNIIFERIYKYIVDCIVVISTHLENKFKKKLYNKIPIYKMPVSAKVFNEAGILKKKKDYFDILYAGTYGKKDGVDCLINAFNEISKEFDFVRLILIGNPDLEIIKNVQKKKLIITGYLEEERFQSELKNADLLCMTRINSEYANAGFPFKLGEYLATGQPVLATKVSNVEFYLEHLKSAYLAIPSDVKSIVEGMKYIINNPKEASIIGQNGKSVCLRFFNPAQHLQELLCHLI